MAPTDMPMERHTWETGLRTSSTARASKPGLTVLATTDATKMERRMARAHSHSRMVLSTLALSFRTRSVDQEDMSGPMARRIAASGRKIRCMDMDCSNGLMESSTKATSSTIKDRVRASSSGKMGESMTVNGKMESSMAKAPSSRLMALGKLECGRMAAIFNGLMTRMLTEIVGHLSDLI